MEYFFNSEIYKSFKYNQKYVCCVNYSFLRNMKHFIRHTYQV